MKFYRVEYKAEGGISTGIEWFTSRHAVDEAVRDYPNDDEFDEPELTGPIEIKPTKAGILEALNRYASHADNG